MRPYRTIAALVLSLIGAAAPAQVAETPEIAAQLLGMGREITREMAVGTTQIYRPLAARIDMSGLTIQRDLRYGPHERNRLDVFRPDGADGTQPIVVFVHGGGFTQGDKSGAYNIGAFFAKQGAVGITINYRLSPEARWPSGAEDIGLLINWIKSNPDLHGGDISKIVLSGSSAGASHVATYGFHEEFQLDDDGVIALIIISPPTMNLTDHRLDPNRDVLYFGDDPATYEAQSVLNHLGGRRLPVLVAYGGLDMALVMDQSAQLIAALQARDGSLPAISTAVGHNHISAVTHIGTGHDVFGEELMSFVNYVALGFGD